MPILTIEITGIAGAHAPGLAARLADASAAVLGSAPGTTWVRLRWLDPGDYAENDGGPPPGMHPVFVSVIEAHPPEGAERERRAASLTIAIAEACGRPADNVHVIYEPPGAGRVAFGGRLVE
jgi:phenylpyruvate tautomerase PptA (4-oxalocrotonate tautomerase family)